MYFIVHVAFVRIKLMMMMMMMIIINNIHLISHGEANSRYPFFLCSFLFFNCRELIPAVDNAHAVCCTLAHAGLSIRNSL